MVGVESWHPMMSAISFCTDADFADLSTDRAVTIPASSFDDDCGGMPPRSASLPASLGDVFTCRSAIAAGVGRGRLRAGDLIAPHRGVRLRVSAMPLAADGDGTDHADFLHDLVLQRVRAYAAVMPTEAVFTGRTALALYRRPLERVEFESIAGQLLAGGIEELHVGVFPPGRLPRARGVRGTQLSRALTGLRMLDGVAVTSPATTWAMFGRTLDVPSLIRLGDAMVRIPRDDRGRPMPDQQLATIDQLRAAASAPMRRGRATLFAALDRVRVGSGSTLETDWRLGAEDAGLPLFELDVEIRDSSGRLLGIADGAHRRSMTIVEIEGDHHRTSRIQWNRDIEKQAAYLAAGWEPVRFTSAHIRGYAPRAPEMLRDVLVRRGWRPGSP